MSCRITIVFLGIMFFYVMNCNSVTSKISKKEPIHAEIKHVFGFNNLAIDPVYKGCGIYNDTLYISTATVKAYIVEFRSFEGKLIRSLSIPMGKGPGEIQYLTGLKIVNDIVYVYDYALKKIEMYSVEGKYLDSVVFDEKLTSMTFDVINENFVFLDDTTQTLMLLGKDGKQSGSFSLTTNKSTANNSVYEGGCLYVDALDKEVYLGKSAYPFRIIRFETTLKEKMRIELDLRTKYEKTTKFSPPEWNGMSMPHGYFMVQSVGTDKENIYASFGAGLKYGKKIELLPIKNALYVFDKKSGKYKASIWNEKLKYTSVGYSIIGITSEYIIISAVSIVEKKLMQDLTPDYDKNMIWFIVLKNPIGK